MRSLGRYSSPDVNCTGFQGQLLYRFSHLEILKSHGFHLGTINRYAGSPSRDLQSSAGFHVSPWAPLRFYGVDDLTNGVIIKLNMTCSRLHIWRIFYDVSNSSGPRWLNINREPSRALGYLNRNHRGWSEVDPAGGWLDIDCRANS